MSNHSDGEDSQMHDTGSLPSSTPSTPPAAASAAHMLIPTSPPNSQQRPEVPIATRPGGSGGAGTGGATANGGAGGGYQPIWEAKKALQDSEMAKKALSDRNFDLSWAGDPFDERDMWNTGS